MGLEKGKGALKLKGDDGSVKKKKKKKDKSLALVEDDNADAKPKVCNFIEAKFQAGLSYAVLSGCNRLSQTS